jgi:hypothetical protein
MILTFLIAIPLIILSGWLYVRLCPKGTSLRSRFWFELPVLLIELLACAGITLHAHSMLSESPDRAWWPVIAIIHCTLLFPSILVAAASIRRMIYHQRLHH